MSAERCHVFYCRSRAEKKAKLRLEMDGFKVFLPISKELRQWSDRKKWVEEVLFRSYVFVNIDLEKQSGLVRRTFGVVNFVYWLHKPAVIQDAEILAIRQFLSDHLEVETIGTTAKIGDYITIESGPLTGQTAKIVGLKNKHEVRLKIESLGFELVAALRAED